MPLGLEQRSVSFEQGGIWNQSLGQQIEYLGINRHRDREGLPSNWADLPGVGFMIRKQMEMLQVERMEDWFAQTEQDIKGFQLEYLARGLVFPIFYKIYEVGGEDRLVAPLYGNKRVVETISSEERNGSVKKAFEEKIEPFLINAPDGSIAVMTSPSGWSGLHDEQGREIEYLDSQTYLWQKKGQEVVGFTIRTDFLKNEHREFLQRLGVSLSESATLEEYVKNVALLSASDYQIGIESIVGLMQKVRLDLSGLSNPFAYQERLWQEVYQDLARREELWQFDQQTEIIVGELKNHVLTNINQLTKQEIQEALAVTILRLARFLGEKGGTDSRRLLEDWQAAIPYITPYVVSYGSVFEELKEQGGCAGGGESESDGIDEILVNSFTPRRGFRRRIKKEKFTCPKCKQQADGPVGDTCPHCGYTKEEHAKKGGQTCG